MRARYGAEVKGALADTLRELTIDQRNVLRMHYLDDLTIDEIAACYRVHRSTAARWIAETRNHILDEVRRQLRERTRSTPSEIDSLLRLVRSEVELTLSDLVLQL